VIDGQQRVGSLSRGQVGDAGGAAAGFFAGVDLDHFALVEDLDELGIGARLDVAPDEIPGHRIESSRDLDVVVSVHLGLAPQR